MTLAAKLQFKAGMSVAVVDAPKDTTIELPEGCEPADARAADAMLVFAENRDQLMRHAQPLVDASRRDALAWVAYPKAGQLGTDLNRDSLAGLLSSRGLRPVRQIAIDDVWSAMRLRPA